MGSMVYWAKTKATDTELAAVGRTWSHAVLSANNFLSSSWSCRCVGRKPSLLKARVWSSRTASRALVHQAGALMRAWSANTAKLFFVISKLKPVNKTKKHYKKKRNHQAGHEKLE